MISQRKKGALREIETERYILSTLPALWMLLYRKDGSSFISADKNAQLFAVTGTTLSRQGRIFDGSSWIKQTVANWQNDTGGSFLFWFKTTNTGEYRYIICSSDEGDNATYLFIRVTSANKLEVIQRNAGDTSDTVNGGTTVTDGVWRLGCVSSSGTAYSISLNGVAESLTVSDGSNNGDWLADTSNRDNIIIGKGQYSPGDLAPFIGSIGEVAYFSPALTTSQQQAYYLKTKWRYV